MRAKLVQSSNTFRIILISIPSRMDVYCNSGLILATRIDVTWRAEGTP